MNLPRSILVPVDFSEFSEHALDFAVELGAKLDAKVHILHALSIPALGVPELGASLAPSILGDMIRDSQEAIDKLAAARRAKVSIGEVMLRTGDARDVILQACAEVRADLIVMGTHGRRGMTRALLGSVASNIIATAPCPVLTIRKGSY